MIVNLETADGWGCGYSGSEGGDGGCGGGGGYGDGGRQA